MAGFGWAKPVQFDPDKLAKKHLYEIIISLAGPLSNFLLGIVLLIICRLLFFISFFSSTEIGFSILELITIWAVINFGLFVFNLIPIPPLDGSHIYTTYLNKISPDIYSKVYRYGTGILFIIIMIENRLKIDILPISPIANFIANAVISILHFN